VDVRFINNVEVTVTGEISTDELTVYLTKLQEKNKLKIIKADVVVDGEYIDVNYQTESVPFHRIRRITGYLVGSTARWGDAKRAELKDRVLHS